MNNVKIELELRAYLKDSQPKEIEEKLLKIGSFVLETKRISVMFLGTIGDSDYDVRVRVTNGKAEVVVKKGDHHSHNRTETSQDIDLSQFVGMVEIFYQFGFQGVKVGERITKNYDLGNDILASLVWGGDICYLEVEKVTDKENEAEVRTEIERIINEFGVKIIETKEEYAEIIKELDEKVDWQFDGSPTAIDRLKEILVDF